MIKLSGRTQPLFPRYSILSVFEVIRRLGFDGVEICLEVDELAPGSLSPGKCLEIREQVARAGLNPHTVGYHTDYIYNDDLFDQTKTAIRLTRALGSDIFIIAGTRAKTGDEEAWVRMLKRTQTLVKLAEDTGVTLAIEFEPGFIVGSTADLLRLFDAIPSPNLAANLDLGHSFLCDPDPFNAIHRLSGKIVHGHIENMRTGVHDHLLPHEGDMDLPAYLAALRQAGFSGALALDLYKHDYEAVAPAAIQTIRTYL